MSENQLFDVVLEKLQAFEQKWDDLFSGEFHLQEILDLITALVQVVEEVIQTPKSGEEKHKLVRDTFYWFDSKYNIIDTIDDLLPLPFFLEPFDGQLLRVAIDFLIAQAVSVLNMTIWKD